MTTYGILVVDPTWHDQSSTTLDKATVQHHRQTLTQGARVLIYAKEPIDALVAEAVISGDLIETETVPPDPAFNPAIPANLRSERGLEALSTPDNPPDPITGTRHFGKNYRVPLDVTRPKMITPPIPLHRLKALLGEGFSIMDVEWIPLTPETYAALTQEWGTNG